MAFNAFSTNRLILGKQNPHFLDTQALLCSVTCSNMPEKSARSRTRPYKTGKTELGASAPPGKDQPLEEQRDPPAAAAHRIPKHRAARQVLRAALELWRNRNGASKPYSAVTQHRRSLERKSAAETATVLTPNGNSFNRDRHPGFGNKTGVG